MEKPPWAALKRGATKTNTAACGRRFPETRWPGELPWTRSWLPLLERSCGPNLKVNLIPVAFSFPFPAQIVALKALGRPNLKSWRHWIEQFSVSQQWRATGFSSGSVHFRVSQNGVCYCLGIGLVIIGMGWFIYLYIHQHAVEEILHKLIDDLSHWNPIVDRVSCVLYSY